MSEKMYNISKNSAQKSASDGDRLRPDYNFLESSNSKTKKDMVKFQFFLKKLVKSGQTTYSRSINVTT